MNSIFTFNLKSKLNLNSVFHCSQFENVGNFLRTLHKCNTSIVNAETRLCECFLQQVSCELNTLLCSTTPLFFTALV